MNELDRNDTPKEAETETEHGIGTREDLERELREKEDRHLRALAELQNQRKRTEQEKTFLKRQVKKSLLLAFLETLDSLERLEETAENGERRDADVLLQDIRAVRRQMLKTLSRFGVARLQPVGKPFDPHYHEAVGGMASDTFPAGSVGAELSKGYTLEDDLLRPSRVKVVDPGSGGT